MSAISKSMHDATLALRDAANAATALSRAAREALINSIFRPSSARNLLIFNGARIALQN